MRRDPGSWNVSENKFPHMNTGDERRWGLCKEADESPRKTPNQIWGKAVNDREVFGVYKRKIVVFKDKKSEKYA